MAKDIIPEGYVGYEPPPPAPTRLTTEEQAAMNRGPGFFSDLLKMSGGNFALSNDEARDAGAGFIGDLLRAQAAETPPEPAEPPVLTAIDPNTAVLGDPDLVLHCYGSGFSAETVIVFSDQDEPTTLVSDSEVTTGVKPSLGWGAVEVPVKVRNGDLTSTAFAFTFTEAAK